MKIMKKILKIVLRIVLVLVIAFAVLVVYLTAAEYKPADRETLEVNGKCERKLKLNQPFSVMTWNIGYGALGANADFFMDGGTHVQTASRDRVETNLTDIAQNSDFYDSDIIFMQEVDADSARSHHIDERQVLLDQLESADNAMSSGNSVYAYNYKVPFIPYPIPPIGKVNSGIFTVSRYQISSSERIQLPCPFSWPVRLGNLKRCLMANRMPIEGSEHELVAINLHLEAYDNGEGKAAQTAQLLQVLKNERAKGNYVIAGGDFNQTFSNVDISQYPVQEGKWQPGIIDVSDFHGWKMLMDSSLPTCRSLDQPYENADKNSFQYYVIDGFIVSDNIEVKKIETKDRPDFQSTDHNPVMLTVELK